VARRVSIGDPARIFAGFKILDIFQRYAKLVWLAGHASPIPLTAQHAKEDMMKKKEKARKRKQKASIRHGQKVLIKIGTNDKSQRNSAEFKKRDDYTLPFGAVGTIHDFVKSKNGKKKKVIAYVVELLHPIPKVTKPVEDLFEREMDKINQLFYRSTVVESYGLKKYYVAVSKELCCFLL